MDAPLRKIVQRVYYQTLTHPDYAWSVRLTLECGHCEFRPASQCPETQKRAHCLHCARLNDMADRMEKGR